MLSSSWKVVLEQSNNLINGLINIDILLKLEK
jgi:hypothetical protein